jgi:hypothetical protein
MLNIALLVVLTMGALAALWPYWQFASGRFRTVATDARIVLREVQLLEAREPRFVLRGEIVGGSLKPRTFSVFPWHSDNVFNNVQQAQQAVRLAGIEDEVVHSLVAVRGVFGTRVHATSRMSRSALQQLKLWSVIACAIPIAVAVLWLQ